jgi:hypothetical protein
MGHITNYRKNANFGLFETIRISLVLVVRRYPEKKEKLFGHQLFADKMCLSSVYY